MPMKKKPAGRDLSRRDPHSPVLLPAQLAVELNVGEDTLYRWRDNGEGPKFCKLTSHKLVYRVVDVDRWLAERAKVTPKPKRKNGADFKSSRG